MYINFKDRHNTKVVIKLDNISYVRMHETTHLAEFCFIRESEYPLIVYLSKNTFNSLVEKLDSFSNL